MFPLNINLKDFTQFLLISLLWNTGGTCGSCLRMKKDSCLAYWGSKYLTEFLHKTNDLHNDIGVPQNSFGINTPTWQKARNVYANGRREKWDCNSNSLAYIPTRAQKGEANAENESEEERNTVHSAAVMKAALHPLEPNSLLHAVQWMAWAGPTRRATCSGWPLLSSCLAVKRGQLAFKTLVSWTKSLVDSDLFRLMRETGLLIEQSRDLSVDHKPGVNVSGWLWLSAKHCSREQEASPFIQCLGEQTFAHRLQPTRTFQLYVYLCVTALQPLCGAEEPGSYVNVPLHIMGTLYMADKLPDLLTACLQRSVPHCSWGEEINRRCYQMQLP